MLAALTLASLLAAQAPVFEVASVKPVDPNGVTTGFQLRPEQLDATGTLGALIGFAYGLRDFQVLGGPDWLRNQHFEVTAKASRPLTQTEGEQALQALLRDRFALQLSPETRQLPIYRLVVAKSGSTMKAADTDRGISSGPSLIRGTTTTAGLAIVLSGILGRPVVDGTGLTGMFAVSIQWSAAPAVDFEPDGLSPSLFSVLQDDLGLKLEAAKGPVETVTVTAAEMPHGS